MSEYDSMRNVQKSSSSKARPRNERLGHNKGDKCSVEQDMGSTVLLKLVFIQWSSVTAAAQLAFLGGSIAAVTLPPMLLADGFDERIHPSACFWIVLEKVSFVALISARKS